jgi:peptidoglycan endopeptidase LytE
VKPGDTLTSIAKSFNVTIADLKRANDMSSDAIRIGQVLNLPGANPAAEPPAMAHKPAETTDPKVSTKNYTVKSGDRLIFIAKKYGVSPEDLIAFNKIKDPAKLQIGQVIKIPTKKAN